MSLKENKAQEEIINTINGQLIVVACPGSGKTTTLVRRIDHMVKSGINPNEIIMMTFSQAAAREMQERYESQFPENPKGVKFCTIHSFCFTVLCQYFNYSRDCIISTKSVYDFFYSKLRNNPDVNNDLAGFIKKLLLDIGNVKNLMIQANEYTPQCTDDKKLFISLYNDYEEYKNSYNMIDFDDMLVLALQNLKKNKNVVAELQSKYKYIQVDEYQDTNLVQTGIIYEIAGEKGNLAVVGDDDQSIYGFRAATPDIMLSFKDVYPNAKIIKMSTNYRSREEIIDASNAVIKNNTTRYSKDFIASRGKGGKVSIINKPSLQEEIDEMAHVIKTRHEKGESYNNFAILFRTNAQADGIANALIKEDIPFISTEPVKSRYDSWMYKDIIAFHNLAVNGDQGAAYADDMYALINKPKRFISRMLTRKGMNYEWIKEQIRMSNSQGWQKTKMIESIDEFFCGINLLRMKSPLDSLNTILYNLHYGNYLKEYAKKHNDDVQDYINLYNAFVNDVKNNNIKTWEDWDKFVIKYNYLFQIHNKKEKKYDAVTISTMHKSKGLEWNVVYLPDCIESKMPGSGVTPVQIEEERRLFYVSMTRAKEELYLYYHGKGTATRYIKELQVLPKSNKKNGDSLKNRISNL